MAKKKKNKKQKTPFMAFLPFIVLAILTLGVFLFPGFKHPSVTKSIILKKSLHISLRTSVPSSKPKIIADVASVTPTPTFVPTIKPVNEGYCLSVPVIYYHHVEPMAQATAEGHASLTVDPNTFAQQMAYLSSHGYTFYTAEQLVDALLGHTSLPGKPIVVTIDDGYIDTYTYAFPIAKQYGVKLSLMIPTGLLENPDYMTWNDLKDMANSGTVFAYDHTWSHYSLSQGPYSKDKMEIMTSKNQLEQHLGGNVDILAYPYGSSSSTAISILQQNGFKGAFTTIPGFLQCDGFVYSLHRNRIGNTSLSAYGL